MESDKVELKKAAEGSAIDMTEDLRKTLVEKVTGLVPRSQAIQRGVATLIQALEFQRKAHQIDHQAPDEDPWKAMLDWVTANNKPLVQVGVQVGVHQPENAWVKNGDA